MRAARSARGTRYTTACRFRFSSAVSRSSSDGSWNTTPIRRRTSSGAATTSQARQPRPPRRRLQQRAQDLDRRGLAGAVRAEEPEDLPLRDRKADAAHRLDVAVALGELVDLDRRRGHVAGETGAGGWARRAPGGRSACMRAASTTSWRGASAHAGSVAALRPRARTPGSGSRRSRPCARRNCGTAPASSLRRETPPAPANRARCRRAAARGRFRSAGR